MANARHTKAGRKRALAGDQLPVLMALTGDAGVQNLDIERPQFLSDQPWHRAGNVADFDIRFGVQRVGEQRLGLVPCPRGNTSGKYKALILPRGELKIRRLGKL